MCGVSDDSCRCPGFSFVRWLFGGCMVGLLVVLFLPWLLSFLAMPSLWCCLPVTHVAYACGCRASSVARLLGHAYLVYAPPFARGYDFAQCMTSFTVPCCVDGGVREACIHVGRSYSCSI